MSKETKGVGQKLAVYVPKEDVFVVDKIKGLMDQHKKEGYRTSLSFELIRLAKVGLIASEDPKLKALVEKAIQEG